MWIKLWFICLIKKNELLKIVQLKNITEMKISQQGLHLKFVLEEDRIKYKDNWIEIIQSEGKIN